MNRFQQKLAAHGLDLKRGRLETLQLNLGRKCNQACRHCHVDAAPWRTEMMDRATAGKIADWILAWRPPVVDLTGGAPELNPNFQFLVETARAAGSRVIDRNNLTIIEEPGFGFLPAWLAERQVEIIASLPCYLQENVNRQRGNGVFEKSISALRKLNEAGYGAKIPLHLVFNPQGPKLPPDQRELEADYKEILLRDHGIVFNSLFTITNQPIARFAEDLRKQGRWEEYMELLVASFNPDTAAGLMCRATLSVGYTGALHDCDFNQMLGLKLPSRESLHLWDISPDELPGKPIATGDHCFACSAGAGSSCGGELV